MENKIEVADALAIKLLQRLNYSVSAMKTSSQHLSEGTSQHTKWKWITDGLWNQIHKLSEK